MIHFRKHRYRLALLHDILLSAFSFVFALYLRLGADITHATTKGTFIALLIFTVTSSVVFFINGIYKNVWALASMRDLVDIIRAVTIIVVSFVIADFLIYRLEGVPRTTPIMIWFILLAGLGGSRMAIRLLREKRLSNLWQQSGEGRVNVLLVGAGDEADIFMRAINSNPQSPYKVVGIVGDNTKRVGRKIHGIEVMGAIDDIPYIVERLRENNLAPSRLIMTRGMRRLNNQQAVELFNKASALGLSLSRLPDLMELRDDVARSNSVHDQPIALEDLLGRPEIKLDRESIRNLVRGHRVLITGAGGTIGGELTRQIAAIGPSQLTLIDSCEFNLYRIGLEVSELTPDLDFSTQICDVRDAVRIEQLFAAFKPELIFHAAAIKHVPLAEENPREAIMTNGVGTMIVADCARAHNVKAMVLISTDKAVNPCNVMGATKRLAEMYCQALDLASSATRFITVRFGNVLGSTGSVVPRFQDQIAKGGPLTVTHPDITRYFMTVREAVELVLQATAHGMQPGEQRGKILVLDMGKPIKIADLARQIIRLAGLKPDDDIKIVYTGLRPGEKLYEELFDAQEALVPSGADGVMLAMARTLPLGQLNQDIKALADILQRDCDSKNAAQSLARLVPEYCRQERTVTKPTTATVTPIRSAS